MNEWLGLRGRNALVLGGGGLGGASAASLAAAGARLVISDANEKRLRDLQSQVTSSGGSAEVVAADLTVAEECRRVVDEARQLMGSVDVFLHAVGRNDRRPLVDLNDDDWQSVLALNLSTAYWAGQAVGRLMCAQGYGRMIFISSVSGVLAHAHHGPYAASKGGLNQLLRVMAREWAPAGVTVNAVAPGYVETSLTQDYLERPGVRDSLTGLVPAGRLGSPQDVADAVTFLASDRAAFVTGHVLYVDGGRTLV